MLKHCTKRFHFPYTPSITVLGVIIGVVEKNYINATYEQVDEGDFVELEKRSTMVQVQSGWLRPSPELVFLIFLPALIFESAFNSDWYTFKR